MADFTIKQNDTLPVLSAVLKVGGVLIGDLASATSVKLVLTKRTAPDVFVFVGTAVVVDAAAGKVAYSWQVGDTATPGEFYGEWHITYAGGGKRKVPTVGKFSISIEASLPEA